MSDRIAEIRQLLSAVTPIDEHTKICRYDHGGGRLYREVLNPNRRGIYEGESDRTLIADFYHEGDREFYNSAVRSVEYLLEALHASEHARQQAEQEIASLHQFGKDWQRQALAAEARSLALSTALRALAEKWKDATVWECAAELEALLSSLVQEQP